jgi:hypothetical protein
VIPDQQTPRLKVNFARISIPVYLAFLFFLPGKELHAQEPKAQEPKAQELSSQVLETHQTNTRAIISGYAELGSTQVSEGVYIRSAALGSCRFGKYRAEAGIQLDLKSNNGDVLSGYSFRASRQMLIREFPFGIQAFYFGTSFSGVLRESNWGLLLDMQRRHFAVSAGTNFRTYAFTREAVDQYGLDGGTRIRENFNLMYSFSCQLKPVEHPWNIGLTMTNIDHFIINQETNPCFNLHGRYVVSPPLELFAETWFQRAGALSLSVNYFGFFFRAGIVWDIR